MLKRKFFSLLAKSYPTAERIFNWRWFNHPFTKSPLASAETYRKLFTEIKDSKYEKVEEWQKTCGFRIDQKWLLDLALVTQVVIKKSPLCFQHGLILYSSLRKYIKDSKSPYINIIETGTARGFSSLCMAKALNDSAADGKILTFDVLPHKTKMYWNCIADANGTHTRAELLSSYQNLLDRYLIFVQGDTKVSLKRTELSRIHFAFLDGAHTFKDVLLEYEYLKDKQKTGDIIVFDDYSKDAFPGVVKAVGSICKTYHYEKQIISSEKNRAYVVATKH